MRLVIAEKPSVARDLARVLGVNGRGAGFIEGRGIRITWCVGHLIELEEPVHYDERWRRWDLALLPMVPETFALRPRKDARDQWRVVKKQLTARDVKEVINACDAGREGELIFRFAYEAAGCRAPVRRLWTSSLTDSAIRLAWKNLQPGADLDGLGDAARCRSEADWLVGLNATRAMTCLGRQAGGDDMLSVGRVQTPTLAMIVRRDREIAAFEPETFFQVLADFSQEAPSEGAPAVTWRGVWFRPDAKEKGPKTKGGDRDAVSEAERLAQLEVAEALAGAVRGRPGVVERASRRRRTEPPPLLYDLTALQRRANQRYSFSAEKTLAIAQTLYERHKVLTYPRTDARYLTPDQVPGLTGVVTAVGRLRPYAAHATAVLERGIHPGRRVVNAAEVGDHHALLPTERTPSAGALSADEKRIYDMVARRLFAVLSPDAEFELAELVVAVPLAAGAAASLGGLPMPPRFRARGRVVVTEGWRAVDPPGRDRDKVLPNVSAERPAQTADAKVKEGQTRPPPPHNDASILKAMETAGRDLDDAALVRAMRASGLGTPATRAAILRTLEVRRYVVRDGKHLRSTPRGGALIDAVPVDALKSAELTGRWEKRLADVADGRDTREAFMADTVAALRDMIDAIRVAPPPPAAAVRRPEGPILGECPACHTPVREGRATYACETGRSCVFVVFKKMAKRPISATMVRTLLAKGRTKVVKNFQSKKGKPFSAGLTLTHEGKVEMYFDDAPRAASAKRLPASPPAPTDPVGMACPRCEHGHIVRGRTAWGCDGYREGCVFRVPFEHGGVTVTPRDAVARVEAAGHDGAG